ncbi:MAG: hypothetical protein IKR85_05770 [Clostridia bacterium]|nr:hypothetical protein [Clostridia bacterium]
MFEIVFIILLAAFAAGWIGAFIVSKKVKTEGIETEAVVSRIELHEWSGGTGETWAGNSVTKEYYITFTNNQGQSVESLLSNPGNHTFTEGDRLRIKYLPDRQEYPVLVEIL